MPKINDKALVIASCWFAVALISSVYIWVTISQKILGDAFFGLFVPIGLLILVAFVVTFGLPMKEEPVKDKAAIESTFASGIREMNTKIDALTKEVETIKKAIEE